MANPETSITLFIDHGEEESEREAVTSVLDSVLEISDWEHTVYIRDGQEEVVKHLSRHEFDAEIERLTRRGVCGQYIEPFALSATMVSLDVWLDLVFRFKEVARVHITMDMYNSSSWGEIYPGFSIEQFVCNGISKLKTNQIDAVSIWDLPITGLAYEFFHWFCPAYLGCRPMRDSVARAGLPFLLPRLYRANADIYSPYSCLPERPEGVAQINRVLQQVKPISVARERCQAFHQEMMRSEGEAYRAALRAIGAKPPDDV